MVIVVQQLFLNICEIDVASHPKAHYTKPNKPTIQKEHTMNQHPRIAKLLAMLATANNGYLLISAMSDAAVRLFKAHSEELAVHGVVITDKCVHTAESWALVRQAQAAQFEQLKAQRDARILKDRMYAAGEYGLRKMFERAEAAQIND